MKTIKCIKGKLLLHKNGIGRLHKKTQKWISEIEFVKIEQEFFKQLLSAHIVKLCSTHHLETAKALLNEIEEENNIGARLTQSIYDQRLNLSLISENIYVKQDADFRTIQKSIKIEYRNYKVKFKEIRDRVFELVLHTIKKERQKKLLA